MSRDELYQIDIAAETCPGEEHHGCCPQEQCSHAELSRLETPEDPIGDRVENAGRSVAATCPMLNPRQLENCFSKLFEITPDCHLYDRFRAAYRSERAAHR